jgi:hypothetical protein
MFTKTRWEDWLAKEKPNYKLEKPDSSGKSKKKYLKKGYLHLDERIWLPDKEAFLQSLLSDKEKVSKRAFYPFLKFAIKTPRYKLDESAGVRSIDYKKRPISFAGHLDALIYSFYSYCLTKEYENYIRLNKIDDCVLAYRTDLNGSCNIDFSREVFNVIKTRGECTAIALDVKGFFDTLNHKILLAQWQKIIGTPKLPDDQYHIFRSLTKYSYINKNILLRFTKTDLNTLPYKPKSLLDLVQGRRDSDKFNLLRNRNLITTNSNCYGIPQGSPISALLSNIYMSSYDESIKTYVTARNGIYRRYCDDILIICNTENAADIKTFAYEEIKRIELTIQCKKEEEILFKRNKYNKLISLDANKIRNNNESINEIDEIKYYKPLQYLGFEFNGNKTFVRSSSLSRYFRKAKARVSKTIKMAYSPISKSDRVFTKKLLHRYTHLGKRNFVTYALNASRDEYIVSAGLKSGMDSTAIRRQMSNHVKKIKNDLVDKNLRRIEFKKKSQKLKKVKIIKIKF